MPGIVQTPAQGNLQQWLAEITPVPSGDPALHHRGQSTLWGPGGFESKLLLPAVPSLSSSAFNWDFVSAGTDVPSEIWAVP